MAIANLPAYVPAVLLKEVLDRAHAFQRIGYVFDKVKMSPNMGQSAILARFINGAISTTPEAEGQNVVTRAPQTETFTATIRRYAVALATSMLNADLDPVDWVKNMAGLVVDEVKMVKERLRWNAACSGTNRIFNSTSVTQRTEVNGPITLGRLQRATASIEGAKGQTFTSESNGSNRVGTAPQEAGFVVLSHTDTHPDVRNLPGFKPRAAMTGSDYPEGTFGSVDNLVFVTSPEFAPILGAGAASTTMRTTNGNTDVYPFVVCARHAFTEIDFKGKDRDGFGNARVNVLDKADKSDYTNARVIVSASWYDEAIPTSDDWSVRIECGATANPA